MNRITCGLAVVVIGVVPGCGGDDSEARVDLPPAAAEGREVFRDKGCAACHGSNGEGGVAPPLVGLFGSEVPLQGREPVIADREYIVESIVDPGAALVEGYNLPMPRTELSEGELDAVVAYVEALAEVAP